MKRVSSPPQSALLCIILSKHFSLTKKIYLSLAFFFFEWVMWTTGRTSGALGRMRPITGIANVVSIECDGFIR